MSNDNSPLRIESTSCPSCSVRLAAFPGTFRNERDIPPDPSTNADQAPNRAMLFGMALCSFAALLLELALTRLFSVVLFYHFAFLAISIALLGLGAGGVFAHLRKSQLARVRDARPGLPAVFDQCVDCSGRAGDRPAHSGLARIFRKRISLDLPRSIWLPPFPSSSPDWNSPSCSRAKPGTFHRFTPPTWRGSARLSGHRPAAQLAGRPEHRVLYRRVHGVGRNDLGRRQPGAKVCRRTRAIRAGPDCRQLLRQTVRHCLRQGRIPRLRMGRVRALECHLARRSGYARARARRS